MVDGKRSLFVDTSGWIEVFGKSDPSHEMAESILARAQKERRPIITTKYWITEFVGKGGKSCRLTRRELFDVDDRISKLPGVEVIHIGKNRHTYAITYLHGRLDKDCSLL